MINGMRGPKSIQCFCVKGSWVGGWVGVSVWQKGQTDELIQAKWQCLESAIVCRPICQSFTAL